MPDPELDALRRAMAAETPAPDAAKKAETLALAMKNFEDLQGSRDAARQNSDLPERRGLLKGIFNMLTNRLAYGLTATTALVAVGFIAFSPMGQDLMRRPDTAPRPQATEAPVVQPDAAQTVAEEVAPEAPRGDLALDDATAVDADGQPARRPADSAPAQAVQAAPEPAPAEQAAPATRSLDAEVAAQVDEALGAAEAQGEVQLSTDSLLAAPSPSAPGFRSGEDAANLGVVAPRTLSEGRIAGGLANTAVVGGSDGVGVIATPPEREEFATASDNPLRVVSEEPVSTFSIDVDTASWSYIRSAINRGQLPPRDAVRIEEMVNYFPYAYDAPEAGDESPFRPTVSVFETPWNPDTQLIRIGLQGEMPAIADRPPLNLVFLIDTSGSMNSPEKLPLLVQSFQLMLSRLDPADEVAIVTYAGTAGVALEPTAAGDTRAISDALDRLVAGGSTNGVGGLEQAYRLADEMRGEGEISRVILATDGDFNVGISDPDALTDYIAEASEDGTYLSVLGFGRGNLQDDTMQALAQNGNGTAAYIDTLNEAQRVLVDQLSGALYPIADDVKVQVEFNPAVIAEYRLIGYETRALEREDFNNDAVDAGELGAGHSVTALYEVTPVGSPAVRTDPLRYGEAAAAPQAATDRADELGFLRLRWKEPGEDDSRLMEFPITATGTLDEDANFAAAIAGFGQLLRGNDALGSWGYDEAIALAVANRGADEFGYRTEAVRLMRLAQSLSDRR
ncbi:DUF3520 domain-containing protein [Rhodobacterales bacterium HKCCE2091]|nr:DUF3520 domain-containing protein [Rhodobacterales bacterium HKCCE2091]